MLALLQRVSSAQVIINNTPVAAIEQGILAFVAVFTDDTSAHIDKILHRLLNYRIFEDHNGKMNLSVSDINGGLLLVPQFTLAADTKKGLRPSFSSAAPPEISRALFENLVKEATLRYNNVSSGVFAADMDVHLVNAGPATFLLSS